MNDTIGRTLPRLALLASAALLAASAAAHAAPIPVVAAENFYGDVAAQIAGPDATVSSILSNPDEDPHLFEASPSVLTRVARARLVVFNGVDYDPWMGKLLSSSPNPNRRVVVAATLVGAKPGANPHLWYDPATMPKVAGAIAAALAALDPANRQRFETNLATFRASMQPVDAEVARLRARFAGTPVTATEPVFGYMAKALGLVMRNERFQLAVMNDTEPSASDVAAMETDLRQHRVRLLVYNAQASDSAATRLLGIARESGIPVLGVTETEPKTAKDYQDWMLGELKALDAALSTAPATAPALAPSAKAPPAA